MPDTVRLDRWLVAARLWKTRTQCHDACEGGLAKVNGASAVPGRPVRAGDTVEAHGRVLKIVALADKRGPASAASRLYDDLTPPAPPKEPEVAPRDAGAGRPTKRDRREMERWSAKNRT